MESAPLVIGEQRRAEFANDLRDSPFVDGEPNARGVE
jgi:hypothetical protein